MDLPAAIAAEKAAETPPKPEEVAQKAPEVAPPPPTKTQLQRLADAAAAAGQRVFTLPESSPGKGVPVGTTPTIYYNRAASKLPGNAAVALKARAAGVLGWKGVPPHVPSHGPAACCLRHRYQSLPTAPPQVGFNRWESIELLPMERCPELAGHAGGEWWRARLPLPELISRVDFVTMDSQSGAVDNNG